MAAEQDVIRLTQSGHCSAPMTMLPPCRCVAAGVVPGEVAWGGEVEPLLLQADASRIKVAKAAMDGWIAFLNVRSFPGGSPRVRVAPHREKTFGPGSMSGLRSKFIVRFG